MSDVAIIGAGPAGLIAAEVLSAAGVRATIYERMPSVARRLLIAGRGGLNLTHSEDCERFVTRYGAAATYLRPMLDGFTPSDLTSWAHGLGQETFVGSSGRVFPKAMKASPLLRAWLARLSAQHVEIRTRRRWVGWHGDALRFLVEGGAVEHATPALTLLALGGASWPKLGADAAWAPMLAARGVELAPFRPANMGFEAPWSDLIRSQFAGTPLKNIELHFGAHRARGEAIVTAYGLEGGAIYALSAQLRDALAAGVPIQLHIDARPDLSIEAIEAKLSNTKLGDTTARLLRRTLGLERIVTVLMNEYGAVPKNTAKLARLVKAIPITLTAPRGLERAISSAGGVQWNAVDEALQLRALPNVYVAGEMLNWEAPTGGYLLQACFATGVHAARAMLARLRANR